MSIQQLIPPGHGIVEKVGWEVRAWNLRGFVFQKAKHCIDLKSDVQSLFVLIYNFSKTELAALKK